MRDRSALVVCDSLVQPVSHLPAPCCGGGGCGHQVLTMAVSSLSVPLAARQQHLPICVCSCGYDRGHDPPQVWGASLAGSASFLRWLMAKVGSWLYLAGGGHQVPQPWAYPKANTGQVPPVPSASCPQQASPKGHHPASLPVSTVADTSQECRGPDCDPLYS